MVLKTYTKKEIIETVFGNSVPVLWYKIGESDIKYLNDILSEQKECILNQTKAKNVSIRSSDFFKGYSLFVKDSKLFVPEISFDNQNLELYFVSDRDMGILGRMLIGYQDQYINFINNKARLNLKYKEFIEKKGMEFIPFKKYI